MAKKDSGGGLTSNKLVRPPVRTGAPAMGVRPGYPDQLGSMKGNHAMDRGDVPAKLTPMQTVKPPISVPLGNQVAGNVGAGGPGAGRTVMRSGSQGQHGAVNPGEGGSRPSRVTGKDILSDFGPERGKR